MKITNFHTWVILLLCIAASFMGAIVTETYPFPAKDPMIYWFGFWATVGVMLGFCLGILHQIGAYEEEKKFQRDNNIFGLPPAVKKGAHMKVNKVQGFVQTNKSQ